MHPMNVDGTQIIKICGRPTCESFADSSASRAAVAAANGLAVIACCEAITLIDIGRSGRIPALRETSAITGRTAYATCPVPEQNVNRYATAGAMNVMYFGLARSAFSAIITSR